MNNLQVRSAGAHLHVDNCYSLNTLARSRMVDQTVNPTFNVFELLQSEATDILKLLKVTNVDSSVLNETELVPMGCIRVLNPKTVKIPTKYKHDNQTRIAVNEIVGPLMPYLPTLDYAFKLADIWLDHCNFWLSQNVPYNSACLLQVINDVMFIKDLSSIILDYVHIVDPYDVIEAGDKLSSFVHIPNLHYFELDHKVSLAVLQSFDKKYQSKCKELIQHLSR